MRYFAAALLLLLLTGPTVTAQEQTWVEVENKVYGAKPDNRGPIGGGEGYADIITKGDYVAEDLESLLDALSKAKAGEVVFIPGDNEIDMTSLIYIDQLVLDVPEGVTLAGNRGFEGSKGAILTSDALKTPGMIRAAGPDVRITGLRIRGPNTKRYLDHHHRAFAPGGEGRSYYYKFPTSDGIVTQHARLRVDNCEISGFSHAAVYLREGDGHHINHNYIHHCQYSGLGYGVCHDLASSLIEYNLFDWNRHSIAGTGRPGCSYTARHNVELGTSLSHCFDMHGGRDRKDGTNIAGTSIDIHNNTFRAPKTPIKIRGVPEQECRVHGNWFPQHNDANEAVIAGKNTEVDDNIYKADFEKRAGNPTATNPGAVAEKGIGMLTKRFDVQSLQSAFLPKSEWRPFPPASDREAWNALSLDSFKGERIKAIIAAADSCLKEPWPELPATLYMQFARDGNRKNYETPYFARRTQLGTLVLAECFTGQGKYLDAIANALWGILEETTWCLPAHAERLENDPLPRLDRESVDLFACETAAILAEVKYLLGSELQALSPTLADRVSQEVLRRVIVPVEEREDFLSGRRLNNWTPWCASNVLCAAMHTFDDNERLAALTVKLMTAVDKWIGMYGEDGGCDEGPNYWGVAAGSLLMFLEHLHSRTDGKVSIYDEQKVKAMGEYITSVQLAGPWFVNVADAGARISPSPAITYRYGERVGSDSMKALAVASLFRFAPADQPAAKPSPAQRYDFLRQMREFWWIPAGVRPEERLKEVISWLPDLQVLVAREDERQDKGLVLAAKGGHNRESHNHNDVGHFIIMLDGHPRIVDVGVETYSRKTFSPERYDIWCIRGNSHNAPVVNGYEQVAGSEHRATKVDFVDEGERCKLAMSLEAIFPKEAGVKSLRREIILDRAGSSVSVTDNLESHKTPATATVTLYACPPVDISGDSSIAIGPGPRRLILHAGPDVEVRMETVPLEDASLRNAWGKELVKITLDYIFDKGAGSYKMDFKASE